jgi:hypothetical protein
MQGELIRKGEPLGPGLDADIRVKMSDNFGRVTSCNAIGWDILGHDGAVANATVTGIISKIANKYLGFISLRLVSLFLKSFFSSSFTEP